MSEMGWLEVLRLRSVTVHVLLGLAMAQQLAAAPMTAEGVAGVTGLCVKSVRRHLRVLGEKGLVVRGLKRGEWVLSLDGLAALEDGFGNGFAVLFGAGGNDDDDFDLYGDHHQYIYGAERGMGGSRMGEREGFEGNGVPVGEDGWGKNVPVGKNGKGRFVPVGDGRKGKNLPVWADGKGKDVPVEGPGKGNVGAAKGMTGVRLRAREEALRPVLAQVGIDWNWKTAQLAACEWVTEDYVRAHVKARPKQLGLVISLMLNGVAAPKLDEENPYDDIDFS